MQRAALIIGFLVVGGVLAEYGWRPRQEYKFKLEGRSLTGLELKPQYAGIFYQGVARIQSQTSELLYIKLQDMTYMNIHQELPTGWWDKTSNSESPSRDLPITGTTIVVKLDRGQVASVSMDKETEDWERNFVQGLISQLQMDLVGAHAMHDKSKNIRHRSEQDASVYKVMEDSVLGSCEVVYEVAPYSKAMAMVNDGLVPRDDLCGSNNYLEITKTKNFSNCAMNVEYHFGLPKSKQCQPGSMQCGDLWRRSSVNRVLGCGERKDFLILSSVKSSRLITNLHYHNASQASVNSYLNLTLDSMKPFARRFNPPSESVTVNTLTYKYSGNARRKERAYHAETNKKKSSQRSSISSEDSEGTTPVPKQKYKYQNTKQDSEEMFMDAPIPSRSSHKERGGRGKGKGKTSPTTSPTTPPPASSQSMEESNEKEDEHVWQITKSDSNRAPHLPFSPFTLAYRQENEGSCLVQQFKELVDDIINDFEAPNMEPERMSMEKLYIAVQMCQTMSLFDLRKIVTGIVDSQTRQAQRHLTERKIYRDVLTMCGTNPAFHMIKSWVEEKVVKGEEAAELIAVLPQHIQTPDMEIIDNFYNLIRSPAVRDDKQLKISAILSFSNLLRVACVDSGEKRARYPLNAIGSESSPKEAARFIPWFVSQLRSDSDLRFVYINALGNTGSNLVLEPLQIVAENNNYSSIQRASAVFAMKYQIFQNSQPTIPILLKLFHDTGNPTSVRIAAVSMLFYAKPQLSIWQRVAVSTWYEPDPAVAAFVRSSLSSLSTMKDPIYSELSQSADSVFSLSKPVSLSPHRAYNVMRTNIVENLHNLISEQFSWIPGPEASNIYYRHTQRVGGLPRVNFEGDIWLMNPDAFFTALQELVYPSDDVTKARPMIKNLSRSTRWIRDALKIEPRLLPKLEGALKINFNKLSERIFPFDKKISVDLAKAGRNLLAQMKGGKQFHYQKMDQSSLLIATATEMGFPVNMHVHVPWALRAVGNATLNNRTKEFSLETTVTHISQLIADISIFTEWDQTVHVSAAYGVSLVTLPMMSYRAKLNKSMSMMEVGLSMKKSNEKNVVIHHSSKSFTTQQDAFNLKPWSIAKSSRVLHMNEPRQIELPFVPHVRLIYSLEASKRAPYNYHEEAVLVHGFPMMWSSMESNSFEVHLRDLNAITIDIGLGGATVDGGKINITRSPGDANNAFEDENTTTTTTPTPTPMPTPATSEEQTTTDSTPTTTEVQQTTEVETDSTTPYSTTDEEVSSTTEFAPSTSKSEEIISEKKDEQKEEDEQTTYSAGFEEDPSNFNASRIDPFSDQGYGSSYNYILNQILRGVGQGQASVIGINITVHAEEPKEYMALVTYAQGMAGRLQRGGFFFKDKKMNDQTVWTGSMYTPPSPLVDFKEVIRANATSRFYLDYDYKYDEDHETLTLGGSISRSERKMAAIRNSMMLSSSTMQQCLRTKDFLSPKCYSLMQDASMLNQYNITVSYNEQAKKAFGDIAGSYFEVAKYMMRPYLSTRWEIESSDRDDAIDGNTVQLQLEVDEAGNTADVMVQFASSGIEFSGVPVHSLVPAALRRSPEYSVLQRLSNTGYCGISNNTVVTYDGVQFQYTPGNCWHVMTKDCSGKSRVVVLVKNTGNQTNNTQAEVNLDNYKVISLKPGPEVYVNQRVVALKEDQVAQVKDQEGTKLVQMSLSSDSAIKLVLPSHGMVVVYSNNTVIVQADAGTQGRLCGFCGNNDNKQVDEFNSPRGRIERTPFEFASSYALKDAECKQVPASRGRNTRENN